AVSTLEAEPRSLRDEPQADLAAGLDRFVDRRDQLEALTSLQPVDQLLAVVPDAVDDVLVERLVPKAVNVRRVDRVLLENFCVLGLRLHELPMLQLVDRE